MSVWGLYLWDNSILDGLNIPEGMDSETVKNNILLDCQPFEVVYPNPEFFKLAVSTWSGKMVDGWTRMYNAMKLEYNPIHNYDRTEEWTDEGTTTSERSVDENGSIQRETSDSEESKVTSTETGNTFVSTNSDKKTDVVHGLESKTTVDMATTGTSSSNTTTNGFVAGYNNSDLINNEKSTGTTSGNDSGTQKGNTTVANSGTDTTTENGLVTETGKSEKSGSESGTMAKTGSESETSAQSGKENESGTTSNKRHGRAFGNIGVTTSQQMLQSEIDIAGVRVMDIIIDDFKKRFCLLVY